MPNEGRRILFECRNVDIGIESRILVRGLNLSVEAGSILVVLGPNGCGKSLSLHTFAGLRAPQAGELKILDPPISAWTPRSLARACGRGWGRGRLIAGAELGGAIRRSCPAHGQGGRLAMGQRGGNPDLGAAIGALRHPLRRTRRQGTPRVLPSVNRRYSRCTAP